MPGYFCLGQLVITYRRIIVISLLIRIGMVNGPVVFDHLSLLLLLIGRILFSFRILNFYGLIVLKYFAHLPGHLAVI